MTITPAYRPEPVQPVSPEFAEPDLTRHLQKAEKLRQEMLAAASDRRWRDFRQAQRRYLASGSAAVVALVEITRKQTWRRRSPEDIERLARHVNPFRECEERVTWRPVRKKGGRGYRLTLSRGPIRRAAQQLVRDALEPVTPDDPRMWMAPGRGTHAALARLDQELAGRPLDTEVVLLDIQDFYGSVSRDWLLENLPLPTAVIESTICPETYHHEDLRPIECLNEWAAEQASRRRRDQDRNGAHPHERRNPTESESYDMKDATMNGETDDCSLSSLASIYGCLDTDYCFNAPVEAVPPEQWLDVLRGLPQGFSTSPLAAQHVAAEILGRCPAGIFIGIYSDNIIALAEKGKGAWVREALLHALESSPAGQFCLSQDQVQSIAEGFEFLRRTFHRKGDRVTLRPKEEDTTISAEDWDHVPAMRQRQQEVRAARREHGARILERGNIPFERKNDGAHLIVRLNGRTVDYWPGTGLWTDRAGNADGGSVWPLIAHLRNPQRPGPGSTVTPTCGDRP